MEKTFNQELNMSEKTEKLNIYQEILDKYGYNYKADGLALVLEQLHRKALTEALVARAFKEWKQLKNSKENNG